MSTTPAERSALLKVRNQRRLNWEKLAFTLRSLGLAASRLSDEEHDRVSSAFWSLDPCAVLVPDSKWARGAEQFSKDQFAVLVGDPWNSDDWPIARVAGPSLAAKCDVLLSHFIDGFFLANSNANHFYFVNADEDPITGKFVVEAASLEISNASD